MEEKRKKKEYEQEIADLERELMHSSSKGMVVTCSFFFLPVGAQASEIEKMLTAAFEEEKAMQIFQKQQLKQSWDESVARKRSQVDAVPDFDFSKAGASSVMIMNGEDNGRLERLKMQKQQMRQWIQEQISEKSYLKSVHTDDNQSYNDLMKLMDEIREAGEREEFEMRSFVNKTVRADNEELAMAQKMRRQIQNSINDKDNKALATSLNCFDEHPTDIMDANGRVRRIDMFRGFTEEQRRLVFLENQELIRQRALAKINSDETDYSWMMQQEMANRAMEQAAYEEEQMRLSMKQQHLDYLSSQIEEQKRVKQDWDRTKYGAIEPGFFDSFGTSAR